MKYSSYPVALLSLLSKVAAVDFTIAGGQIFTPGFAVLDAPQPGTPLGGGMCLYYTQKHGHLTSYI